MGGCLVDADTLPVGGKGGTLDVQAKMPLKLVSEKTRTRNNKIYVPRACVQGQNVPSSRLFELHVNSAYK